MATLVFQHPPGETLLGVTEPLADLARIHAVVTEPGLGPEQVRDPAQDRGSAGVGTLIGADRGQIRLGQVREPPRIILVLSRR